MYRQPERFVRATRSKSSKWRGNHRAIQCERELELVKKRYKIQAAFIPIAQRVVIANQGGRGKRKCDDGPDARRPKMTRAGRVSRALLQERTGKD